MKVPKSKTPDDVIERENILKNMCMNFIIDIRERKKRPKLSDFMAVYKSQKDEPDAKEKFQKKTHENAHREFKDNVEEHAHAQSEEQLQGAE